MLRFVQGKSSTRLLTHTGAMPTGAIRSRSVAHTDRVDRLQCGNGAADDKQNDLDAGPEEELECFPRDI